MERKTFPAHTSSDRRWHTLGQVRHHSYGNNNMPHHILNCFYPGLEGYGFTNNQIHLRLD